MVTVVFLHPDLGIGGAERLVVDAALALQTRGHKVFIQAAFGAGPSTNIDHRSETYETAEQKF